MRRLRGAGQKKFTGDGLKTRLPVMGNLLSSAHSLPGVLAAIMIGRMLNHRLRGDGFFRYVYAGLILIGGVLILQAVSGVN